MSMGDGGVACMPSQHVMERLPISETYCRGNGGGFSSNSSLQQLQRKQHEKKMVVKKEEFDLESSQKGELEKIEFNNNNSSSSSVIKVEEVEKGEIKEEVEEGELASGKDWKIEIENGEFIPEKLRKREVEKGEFIPGKWGRGEFIPDKRQKWESERSGFPKGRRVVAELEKGEFVPDKWRKREFEKSEFGPGRRGQREVLERGEFVPHKSQKEEFLKDEFSYNKGLKRDIARDEFFNENGRVFERERTSASTKFTEEDAYHRKELNRSGNEWSKKYPRWDPGHNRDTKIGLRAPDGEPRSFKFEGNDGKSYRKDYSSGNWLKRQGADSGQNGRRYLGDFADHSSSKSRRTYDGNNHSEYLEKHQTHHSLERFYGTASSVSRISSSSRYSSKHSDSSRRTQDRYGPCPNYIEQSLHDRTRHQDRHEGSPTAERSPNDQARYYNHRIRRSPHQSRHYDLREHSPGYMDSSPVGRGRSSHARARPHDRRERTPGYLESSPHEFKCSPNHDYRDCAPSYMERSLLDCDPSPYVQVRHPNCRNHRPGQERSPLDAGKSHDHLEDSAARKEREEEQISVGEQSHEDKLSLMDPTGRDSNEHSSAGQPQLNKSLNNDSGFVEISSNDHSNDEEKSQNLIVDCVDLHPQVSGETEEVSMEEDMDISNTPPHVPVVDNLALGTWFYLDHFGMEQGPSKLCNLRRLVDEGLLQTDHLVKHSGNDWWVTVENAVSPLVTTNFQSIVSDMVSQLVSPPEAPGNLLEDVGDAGESAIEVDQEQPVGSPQLRSLSDDSVTALGPPSKNLHIDDRVDALLKGYAVIPGRELETLGEALHMAFEHMDWGKWDNSEGFTKSQPCSWEPYGHRRDEEFNGSLNNTSKEVAETRPIAPCNKDYAYPSCDSSDWFFGRWSCKGGDWNRNGDANMDKSCRRKLVLNEGYPLCEMPKSGYKDPRWVKKDELYNPSRSIRLNLPSWAFSLTEERNDGNGTSRTSQLKAPLVLRGVKGTMLPVVRINACVVNNQASLVPEPRVIVRGNERHSSRYNRSGNDGRSLSEEGTSRSKRVSEPKCIVPIITPKDRVCLVDELQLHLGDWYYFDGAGHEHGPSSFTELQAFVEKGTIQKHTSVFRKSDNVWVPVSYAALCSKASVYAQGQDVAPAIDSSAAPSSQSETSVGNVSNENASSFHHFHPQYIGYTRGKLHELVMKSYKSREFAAAINEVLDPWINAKQVKELESMQKFRRSEEDHNRKRARIVKDESEDDHDLEGHLQRVQKDDFLFDDLCGDATFVPEKSTRCETNTESWGLLNGYILARVFHFLRADMKSLVFSAATCRHWNEAVKFYRDITKQVDLSDSGPDCTDSMFRKILHGYNNLKIASIVLIGCTNISADVLQEVLLSFPSISSIDIGGCMQFRELTRKFQNIKWINNRNMHDIKASEDSYFKQRSLKQITERGHPFTKTYKGSSNHLNEFCESDFLQHDSSLDGKNSISGPFPQSSYKRKKPLDSRKSASILSRDARMRHWLYRKSENGYKRIEELLTLSLKEIMKENTFDFFIPKIAEIKERMENGYYNSHGLKFVKEDISRVCRDAIKAKNRGDARDMKPIIVQFVHLAASLEENAKKSSRERDELLKMLKDQSKKKSFKIMNDRKTTSRSNGTVYFNCGADHGDYVSDQELRRRISKLNKKSLHSENETSDDLDQSSNDTGDDSESTISDTESDLVSGGRANCKGDGYFLGDEAVDSMTEDREWGARMTKASLVPPVTRKYEVIDRYVIIADEEEVQRKMCVSLPEDYVKKLNAQNNPEESMEIPEVKGYKPRKQLGEEVLEQEVYGIDPYTYNLLLDSMPELLDELHWTIEDKHSFIENTLLCALNMKVRHFTGTGNAPMKYLLQPVVEEILKNAEDGDKRLIKMCQGILKAMRSRPEDNYIAYRKGLGVVCNKEEGFGQDDFVVEFLGEVYPAWKWFEKQDGIRSFQKNNKDPAPEFYNIHLERPKGDRDGYDLVVVDAMHKANYASRICHSCHPNCEAKVTAVDGQYQIGVYTVAPIRHGEEITFDYNSVTESKEEYEASVCLCGNHICRGSYLNLTGEGAYQKVLMECHGMLDRHELMLEACESNFVSEEDYIDLGRAGLGSCLLAGLPVWLVAYVAGLVRFINFERTKLPEEILRHNMEEKRKYFSELFISDEQSEANEAEVQAEGVYNQRLQNLALTLDKVRYVMRCVYHDPKQAPPPLKKLTPEEVVSVLWKGEGSLVEELLQCMAPHTDEQVFDGLQSEIHDHDPSGSDNLMGELQKSLLWLRDKVRELVCTYKCRHDAAADLIHIYAYTKCYFRVQEYKTVTSPPVYISPLDLGPKYVDKLGSGFKEYSKKYGENYCLGQLMYWHSQNNADPDGCLLKDRRGCLSLPEISSFYAKANKPSLQRVYGPRAHRFMLSRIEKHPQKPWPIDKIWSFKSVGQVFGSPMLDAVVNKTSVDKDMLSWLKVRAPKFQAKWDK